MNMQQKLRMMGLLSEIRAILIEDINNSGSAPASAPFQPKTEPRRWMHSPSYAKSSTKTSCRDGARKRPKPHSRQPLMRLYSVNRKCGLLR